MNYHERSLAQNINYRKSGFLLAGIVAVIYTLLFLNGSNEIYLALIAGLLALFALLNAWPLRKALDVFIGFGNLMHVFTNPLVFGLIYVVAVIPTSIVLRLIGKDVLELRYDNTIPSYWKDQTIRKVWKESFRNQY